MQLGSHVDIHLLGVCVSPGRFVLPLLCISIRSHAHPVPILTNAYFCQFFNFGYSDGYVVVSYFNLHFSDGSDLFIFLLAFRLSFVKVCLFKTLPIFFLLGCKPPC